MAGDARRNDTKEIFNSAKTQSRQAESSAADSGKSGFEKEPEGKNDWFRFQRAYPFDDVPADARRKAWDNRPPKAAQHSQTWMPLGPQPTTSAFPANWGNTSGRINAVAVSPANPNLILIGAATGGLWRSTDGGANFVPVSDSQVDLAVGCIAFAPAIRRLFMPEWATGVAVIWAAAC